MHLRFTNNQTSLRSVNVNLKLSAFAYKTKTIHFDNGEKRKRNHCGAEVIHPCSLNRVPTGIQFHEFSMINDVISMTIECTASNLSF